MGSFDRFFAFLLEKTCGNLPLWLTPIQAEIINVGSAHRQYAELINRQLKADNIRTELSDENQTVSKRIREAEIQKIPYILVVGDRELANNSVNVRSRKGNEGEINLEKLIERIGREIAEKTV
ncbi:MAG: His/Gly/Thr/Pro-type tRNA ligase C-terminal domain-containing protein [Candidatus Paceibacterota bacterium]